MMHPDDLKQRTKQFSIDIFRLIESLPSNRSIDIIGRQLIRAASSVGANYRSACRARSKADFISKIIIVEEEADECQYWLELLQELGNHKPASIEMLLKEAKELTAFFTASGKTAKKKMTIFLFRNLRFAIRN